MATLRDVAADAGVSVSTASRVLTGARRVRPDSAVAVLQSAARLGYEGHHVARALRQQATQSVGVIVPVISNPFFPLLIQTIERQLHHEHDLAVMFCDSQDLPDLEAERIRALRQRQIDALLVVPCHLERSADAIRAAADALPVVQIDRWAGDSLADTVSVDHAAAIDSVVDHLASSGRRNLAYAGAAVSNAAARSRATAFTAAVDRTGVSAGPRLEGTYTIGWGREAARQLLEMEWSGDAIVCGNDLIAIGVLGYLQERGVAVPDTVAITGFDGLQFTASTTPPLTTLRQPIDDIARHAVDLLLTRMDERGGPPQTVRLDGELVVRASSGGDDV